ncbi:MAG: hypothetical protein ACKVP0_07210 [Pirellulaceae bacterium]
MSNFLKLLSLFALLAQGGCGAAPVSGGTKGRLQAGNDGLGDVQVTVHQEDAGKWQPVGFGVTDFDGRFQLVQNGAKGPLWLSPGEYRCTLQSAGTPVAIPEVFGRPETTPLQATVKGKDDVLEFKTLEFPIQK